MSALKTTESGKEFLDDLNAYGQRSLDLALPSWIEDPAPVIKNLKDYVAQDDRDPMDELEALAAEREEAIASAR